MAQGMVSGGIKHNVGDVAAVSAHMDAGTVINVIPAKGYTDGITDASTIDLTDVDADLVATNVRYGKGILGVTGTFVSVTAGATVMASSSTTASTNTTTFTALKTCSILWDGEYIIGAYFYSTAATPKAQYRVYKDGTGVGTIFSADLTALGTHQHLYFSAGASCTWRILTTTATETASIYNVSIAANGGFTIT